MRIRPATPDDLPAIIALSQEAKAVARWSQGEYERILTQNVPASVPRRLALVIEDGEEIQGFLVAKAIEREWELENIVIAEPARRGGLATRLLNGFLGQIRRESAESVHLEVRESNQPARTLYNKFDFIEIGRRPSYYQHPEEDAILCKLSFK